MCYKRDWYVVQTCGLQSNNESKIEFGIKRHEKKFHCIRQKYECNTELIADMLLLTSQKPGKFAFENDA